MNYKTAMDVTKEMVEYWLVDDKYEDALSKLTDLINDEWTHGNSDTKPTFSWFTLKLRRDIFDLWGEYQYDIKNRGEEA